MMIIVVFVLCLNYLNLRQEERAVTLSEVELVELATGLIQWGLLINTAMNFYVPQKQCSICWSAEWELHKWGTVLWC